VLFGLNKLYFIWRNNQRAKVWDAMTVQEKGDYLAANKDLGNKR
jgi:hypothetical protein